MSDISGDVMKDVDPAITSVVDAVTNLAQTLVNYTIGGYEQRIGAWSAETFPHSTPESTVLHLWQEAVELRSAVRGSFLLVDVAEEMADIFHLLIQLARLLNIDLQNAVEAKFQKNRKRTWKEPDEFGVVYHDQEGT